MDGVPNLLIELSVRPIVRGLEHLWTVVAVIGVVAIWFLGRGIVIGTLADYENMTGRYEAHEFSWASPDVTLGLQSANPSGSVTLVGRADHGQRWTLDCAGEMHASVEIRAGLFRQLLPLPSRCENRGVTIHSDWANVPADKVGSRDSRLLSYQLFAVESGADTLKLDKLVRNSSGLYGIEPIEFRSDPEGILTERWDANWYRDIAQRGYRFNGDGSVQQNVAWPFLFPWLVKGVAVAWRLPVASAMIGLNAVLLLAALLLLFAIGRACGLTHSLSLVAPAWLSFNPFAFFVVGGFSEPLFLTLEFLIALLILHRKYGLSAVMLALLTATRFIGLIGVGWVVITVWYDTSISRLGRLWRIAVASGAGLLGMVADIAIKEAQTGYPSAAFVVRKSWQVTRLSVLGGILHPYTLFSGGYLLALLLPALLAIYATYVLAKVWRHAGMAEVRLLLGIGISLISTTLVLSPELHAAGRYFLPFTPAIIGLLACVPLRTRSLSFILIATAAGGAFMPFIVEHIAMGQPPY